MQGAEPTATRSLHFTSDQLASLTGGAHGTYALVSTTDRMTSFGQQLVELREARGWSRNRLHMETGLGLSYLHGIETDQWLPGPDKLVRIVDAIGGSEAARLLAERDRIEFDRMGLDPDATLMMKEISGQMTDRDRREILDLQQRIRDRQRRRDSSTKSKGK